MIDLRTDDGVGEALRAIAAWDPPRADERTTPATAPLAPTPRPTRHRRTPPPWSIAAAILAVALVAGLLVVGRDRQHVPAGGWRPMAASPLAARFAPVSLWMGDRLLVWGGHDAEGTELADGATYDPTADRWAPIADQPFPYERRAGSPVGASDGWWTTSPTPGAWFEGKAWFVLSSPTDEWGWDLVSYDPATDRWAQVDAARFEQQPSDALVMTEGTATVQSPVSLVVHGDELLVVGWDSQRSEYGWASFDPASGTWGAFTGVPGSGELYGVSWATPGPILMDDRYLVWVSNKARVPADGLGFIADLDGGDVVATWPVAAPTDDDRSWVAGLTDDGVAVGGSSTVDGRDARRFTGELDPATGRWSALPAMGSGPVEAAQDDGAPAVVDADGATVVVGGLDRSFVVSGLRSTHGDQVLAGDRWRRLPEAPIDLARTDPIAVWTGTELLVWGGVALAEPGAPTATVPLADGARYVPR